MKSKSEIFDKIKLWVLELILVIAVILFMTFCFLGIIASVQRIKYNKSTVRDIDDMKGRVYQLEEDCERLDDDIKLQKSIFSAYVNGELVE